MYTLSGDVFIHDFIPKLLGLITRSYVIQTSTTKSSNLTVCTGIGYKMIALIVKAFAGMSSYIKGVVYLGLGFLNMGYKICLVTGGAYIHMGSVIMLPPSILEYI